MCAKIKNSSAGKTNCAGKEPGYYINSGLLFALPIAVTILVLLWVYGKLAPTLSAPFLWFYAKCGIVLPAAGSLGYELICVVQTVSTIVLLLWLIGFFVGDALRKWIQMILERLPVISTVFKPVNQAVGSLLGDGMSGKPVVRVPFPDLPSTAIGIIMDEDTVDGRACYVVMIPLTMSAGTGLLLTVPKTDVQLLEGVEASQALAYAISCGMTKLR